MESSAPDTSYTVPQVLKAIGSLLEWPRAYYSTDATKVYLENGIDSEEYTSGLLVLPLVLFFLLLSWLFILFFLKLKGKEAGCAAGEPFRTNYLPPTFEVDQYPASPSESARNQRRKRKLESKDEVLSGQASDNLSDLDSSTIGSENDLDAETFRDECEVSGPSKRERRTQIAFLFFSFVILTCVPLALVFSFAPLKESQESSASYMAEAQEIVNQVNISLVTITEAAVDSVDIMALVPASIQDVCPGLAGLENSEVLAVELNVMLDLIVTDYYDIERDVSDKVKRVRDTLASISDSLTLSDQAYDNAGDILWILPGILFLLSSLTLIMLFGVFLAWKRESNKRLQCLLSYCILPAFMVLCLLCWSVTAASAVGTAFASDVCTFGNETTTPNNFVNALLKSDNSSDQFILLSEYVDGCTGVDPTEQLAILENRVQDIIDYIWRHLSNLDSAGRSVLVELCGGGQEIEDFLAVARDLAKLLTSVRKAVNSARTSLDCDSVHSIYAHLMHETACTDVATSLSWGFVIFSTISVAAMCILSLRAAWLYKLGEDLIFDEDEVAENMIVNEHEEYLEYISRYKHEWQEYGGVAKHVNKDFDRASATAKSVANRPQHDLALTDQYDDENGVADDDDSEEMGDYEGPYDSCSQSFAPSEAPFSVVSEDTSVGNNDERQSTRQSKFHSYSTYESTNDQNRHVPSNFRGTSSPKLVSSVYESKRRNITTNTRVKETDSSVEVLSVGVESPPTNTKYPYRKKVSNHRYDI